MRILPKLLTGRLLFLLPAVFLLACGAPAREPAGEGLASADTAPAPLPADPVLKGDPSFPPVTDTYSVQGPRNIVRSVLRHSNGKMWAATWEGLIAYNGDRFTNFTLLHGLVRYHFFSLLEDRNGYLWAGTVGGGVYFLDGRTFRHFTTANGLADNDVFSILEDRSGNIWFGTGKGLTCYDGSRFTSYTMLEGLSSNMVNTLAQDRSGKLWVGTDGGMSILDPAQHPARLQTVFRSPGKNYSNVRSILQDRSGRLWIASREGLDLLHPDVPNGLVRSWAAPGFTGNVFEDIKGAIWLSHGGGYRKDMMLSRVEDTTGLQLRTITSSKQIFGVGEDRSGAIWVGTEKGILRVDGKGVTAL